MVGDDGRLSRAYVIDDYDRLELPGLAPLDTRGKTLRQVETTLAERLVEAGLVRPLPRVVDVSLMESAGLSVPVSGAVFQAGTVRIGERARETLVGQREGPASGDANSERSVAAAIRAAGGARPDADLTRIRVVRGQRWTELDLSGLLDGTRLGDVRLSPGDRVIVPSTACFDERLVRPSPLTPPASASTCRTCLGPPPAMPARPSARRPAACPTARGCCRAWLPPTASAGRP